MWWSGPAGSQYYSISDGILTVTGNSGLGLNLCTRPASQSEGDGLTWTGGYFEFRILAHDWSGGGLYSAAWAERNFSLIGSYGGGSELDILETDEGTPDTAVTTLHSNTQSSSQLNNEYGLQPDRQNTNNNNKIPNPPMVGKWHTVGALWTQTKVTWYVDNLQVATTTAFPSDWQPMYLCLWTSPGGVNGGPTVLPVQSQYDFVHIWH
jgi:beta-glucanase (GH16 family)